VLDERRANCRQLLDLARQQNRFIQSNDYSQLMSILGQKQRILGRMDEFNRRHADLARKWITLRETGQTDLRGRCETALSEIETILAELLELEKEGAEHLTQHRDATRRQLESISQGSRVHDVYRDSLAPVSHRHLDLGR
jgi:hypothetical protein